MRSADETARPQHRCNCRRAASSRVPAHRSCCRHTLGTQICAGHAHIFRCRRNPCTCCVCARAHRCSRRRTACTRFAASRACTSHGPSRRPRDRPRSVDRRSSRRHGTDVQHVGQHVNSLFAKLAGKGRMSSQIHCTAVHSHCTSYRTGTAKRIVIPTFHTAHARHLGTYHHTSANFMNSE